MLGGCDDTDVFDSGSGGSRLHAICGPRIVQHTRRKGTARARARARALIHFLAATMLTLVFGRIAWTCRCRDTGLFVGGQCGQGMERRVKLVERKRPRDCGSEARVRGDGGLRC